MSYTKRIVCLANSEREGDRCIAGIEIVDGDLEGWIRPVSSQSNPAVSPQERKYHDDSEPALLDIIDIPLLRHQPNSHQQENWLLDRREKMGKS